MSGQIAPEPLFQAFANTGAFLVGGLLYTYIAGTATPQATYTDGTLTTANTNPVVLNAMGQAPVWLNPLLAYKFVLTDAAGNPYWTADNINNTANLNYTFTGVANSAPNVQFTRNSSFTGGTLGFTTPCVGITTNVTSAGDTNNEWPLVVVLNNSAASPAENVAAYLQGNKEGNNGPTWGAVVEVIERAHVNNPTFGTTALEVDVSVNGTDNSGFGNRVGLDLVIRRQDFTSGAPAGQANWGYRIDSSDTGALVGFGFSFFPGSTAIVGFDTSHATMNTAAIQIALNQPIIFDGPSTQANKLMVQTGSLGLDYIVNGTLEVRLLASGGLQVQAAQVVGPQIGGYGTPTGNVKTSSFPGATATLIQTSEMLAQLIIDLKTHGLLGA